MILQALSEAAGISGQEEAVRQIILEAIAGHVEDIHIDPMGNILALKKGTEGDKRPKIMLAAHMDEVGFMVSSIDSNGLIRVVNVGGIDARILPGLRVRIGENKVPGVFIWPPIHVNRDQNVVDLKNLRIDIGASSKEAAQGRVKPGDMVVFDSRFMEIGDKVLRGKAFDDRVGCSLLVDIVQGSPYPADVLVAFTVQEEIGLRGAKVAAQRLQPDVALVLEGTTANDIPDPHATPDDLMQPNPTCKLGAGPALTVIDRSMIVDPRLLRFLRDIGDKHGITYQLKTARGGGTDGGSIHLSNAGVPSAVISMPCRYIHSPSAYLNKDDYAATLALAKTALQELTWDILKHD